MCKNVEMLANHIHYHISKVFPSVKVYKSKTSNSIYIYHHILRAKANGKWWHLKAFTIRISDHGTIRDTHNNISMIRRNVLVKSLPTAYRKADRVVQELSNICVKEISETVLNEIKKRALEQKKLQYFMLRTMANNLNEEVFA